MTPRTRHLGALAIVLVAALGIVGGFPRHATRAPDGAFAAASAKPGAKVAPRPEAAKPARASARGVAPNRGVGLLNTAAARYAGQQQFDVAGVLRETVGSGPTQDAQLVPFALALAAGGRQREDYGDARFRGRVLSDGRHLWTWMSALGQHTRYTGSGPTLDALAGSHLESSPPGSIASLVAAPVAGVARHLVSAEWLREDTLQAEGRVIRCDVIAATYRSPAAADTHQTRREIWISREDGLVWRHGSRQEERINDTDRFMQRSQFITFTRVKLGGAIADTMFRFEAPEGSREVLAFEPPGKPRFNLTGLAAPPFSLADLEGKQHDLVSQSGKVVLLDFWASWCGPCRMTMPALDRLTREFAGQGLIVYSVNMREKPETAAKYMQKYGYSMTTLLDTDGSTARRFGVSAIPVMVVIGREGKVVAHLTGAHGEPTMRAALERAGIQ